jgi:Mlc titration factor MtfA (ptsG expression regulator)
MYVIARLNIVGPVALLRECAIAFALIMLVSALDKDRVQQKMFVPVTTIMLDQIANIQFALVFTAMILQFAQHMEFVTLQIVVVVYLDIVVVIAKLLEHAMV